MMDEDSVLNDGKPEDSPKQLSPKIPGKKLKLNDGSSQDSIKATDLVYLPSTSSTPTWSLEENVPSTSKDENADSGVSADKSGATSSDDKSASTFAGPSNEVVNISASGSNVQTILLNIRQPNRCRNYRKRKTPDDDTDSNASSNDDSDVQLSSTVEDDSFLQNPPVLADDDSESGTSEFRRIIELCATSDSGNSNQSNNTNEHSHSSSSSASSSPARSESPESPSMLEYESEASNLEEHDDASLDVEESETDEEPQVNRNIPRSQDKPDQKLPEVLLKEKPKHDYLFLKELINREMGLTFPHGKTTKDDLMFCQRFYGSLHAVTRLKRLHTMSKHKGCVNAINFHPEGKLLVSGSDDTQIIIWDWASNKMQLSAKTGHKSNVFQSKFLHLNAQSQLNIVTCARDGQVRLIQCPPSGGSVVRRRLFTHARAAHKLHVSVAEPHAVLSAGEDGLLVHIDVRTDSASRLVHVKDKGLHSVPLYSVHGHPLDPNELIVAGRDKYIRMYDRRKCAKPLALYSPTLFVDTKSKHPKTQLSFTHLTCAIYNHNGRQILGSYNDEDIYLIDVAKDVYEKNRDPSVNGYRKRYSGHRNTATFKGVSFFGPKSEYVVTGSDCAHIYIWSTNNESIVHWVKGDSGVVNCVEAHPKSPVLASSGLDRDVKIWIPRATVDPSLDGLEQVVRDNINNQSRSSLFNDFLPTLYSAWRAENRMRDEESPPSFGGNIEFDGNVCSTF